MFDPFGVPHHPLFLEERNPLWHTSSDYKGGIKQDHSSRNVGTAFRLISLLTWFHLSFLCIFTFYSQILPPVGPKSLVVYLWFPNWAITFWRNGMPKTEQRSENLEFIPVSHQGLVSLWNCLILDPALLPAFPVCQVWRTFNQTCSNSLIRLPVPGYPIKPWLTGFSSLALPNQSHPANLCSRPSILSTHPWQEPSSTGQGH